MALLDVIQFEGPIDALVWKSPVEDFNTTSILIVDETHQALVLVNGTQYGLYGPGRHVLETPNLPLAKKIINIPTGGKTSFPCNTASSERAFACTFITRHHHVTVRETACLHKCGLAFTVHNEVDTFWQNHVEGEAGEIVVVVGQLNINGTSLSCRNGRICHRQAVGCVGGKHACQPCEHKNDISFHICI